MVSAYKDIVREHTGADFPQDPREQLELAIEAVFRSWNTERARLYRRRERIPHHLGTAVNVVSMVFGNLGETSGTGVCFTRDPSSGHSGVYGDYLSNAQGEDVVSGIRNTLQLADLEEIDPKSYKQLRKIMRRLETHYRDLCDIEFTIEQGKLWMLQTRIGKRTAGAAFRIACQLDDEGLITTDEALERVTGNQLSQLLFPQFDAKAERDPAGQGPRCLSGRGRRRDRVRQRAGGGGEGEGQRRHPGAAGDQSRGPARHGRLQGRAHDAGRQDLARRGRGAGHGHVRGGRRRDDRPFTTTSCGSTTRCSSAAT